MRQAIIDSSSGDTINFASSLVNATRLVDGTDVSLVQQHIGKTANSTNFRFDVDASGFIDANDVSLVQSHIGTSLSPPH